MRMWSRCRWNSNSRRHMQRGWNLWVGYKWGASNRVPPTRLGASNRVRRLRVGVNKLPCVQRCLCVLDSCLVVTTKVRSWNRLAIHCTNAAGVEYGCTFRPQELLLWRTLYGTFWVRTWRYITFTGFPVPLNIYPAHVDAFTGIKKSINVIYRTLSLLVNCTGGARRLFCWYLSCPLPRAARMRLRVRQCEYGCVALDDLKKLMNDFRNLISILKIQLAILNIWLRFWKFNGWSENMISVLKISRSVLKIWDRFWKLDIGFKNFDLEIWSRIWKSDKRLLKFDLDFENSIDNLEKCDFSILEWPPICVCRCRQNWNTELKNWEWDLHNQSYIAKAT